MRHGWCGHCHSRFGLFLLWDSYLANSKEPTLLEKKTDDKMGNGKQKKICFTGNESFQHLVEGRRATDTRLQETQVTVAVSRAERESYGSVWLGEAVNSPSCPILVGEGGGGRTANFSTKDTF